MAEVSMPFTGQDAYAVLTGVKTCTTWLQRKGCKGDTFRVTYAPMNITKTYRITRVLVTYLTDELRGIDSALSDLRALPSFAKRRMEACPSPA